MSILNWFKKPTPKEPTKNEISLALRKYNSEQLMEIRELAIFIKNLKSYNSFPLNPLDVAELYQIYFDKNKPANKNYI